MLSPPSRARAGPPFRPGLRTLAPVGGAARFFSTWTFQPLPAVVLAAAAAGYVWAARRIGESSGRPWPRARLAWFLSGLALIWIVILGPFGAYDDVFFWSHMVQHIVLMMVAGPMLMLGAPVTLILRAATPAFRRRRLVPILRSRAVRALGHPLIGWAIFAGVLLGAHFTAFYNFALYHEWIHNYIEHPLFLGAGMLFYWPILGIDPGPVRVSHPVRILLLFLMMPVEALTGFIIYSSPTILYPFYLHVDRPFGPGPLTDQHYGGVLMWVVGMLIDILWILVAVAAWYRHDQKAAARLDARLDAELAAAQVGSGLTDEAGGLPQPHWTHRAD